LDRAKFEEPLTPLSLAEAALLEPPERQCGDHVVDQAVVDHDPSDIQRVGDTGGHLAVGGPDAGREAERAVIGLPDGLLDRIDRRDDEDRPENFLGRDSHVARHIGEDRRRVVASGLLGGADGGGPTDEDRSPLSDGVLDELSRPLILAIGCDGPEVEILGHLGPRTGPLREATSPVHDEAYESVVGAPGDERTLHGDATLPGVQERSPSGGVGGTFQVGVLGHDHRVVAAEFQEHRA
jgi:hypothetical protein